MAEHLPSPLIEKAKAFTRDHVNSQAETWEIERAIAETTLRKAMAAGFGGLLVAEKFKGSGASFSDTARVLETIAAGDLGFAFSLVVHNNLAASLSKDDAQRPRHLEKMLSGEKMGAFCLTEPDVGTDAAAITTRARRDGNGWILNGAKAWVTNAVAADIFCVYAQTDDAGGAAGIASFLVPRTTPGLTIEPAYTLLGAHAMGTSGLVLKDVYASEDMMFLPPGRGFKGAMTGIDLARVLLSAMCCGILGRSLDEALSYAASRQAFGQSILAFQGLQWQLAEVATNLEAARLLTYRAAALLDDGSSGTIAAAHAKKFATRAAMGGVTACMQAMGAEGLRTRRPLARHLAAAKVAEYLDGTTDVQNIVIARSLVRGHSR